jgi:hypothetical protein
MRAASGSLGRPDAAADIARLLGAVLDDTASRAEPDEQLQLTYRYHRWPAEIDRYPLPLNLPSKARLRPRRERQLERLFAAANSLPAEQTTD